MATVGDPLVVWALRLGAPAAALFLGLVLFRAGRRPGKLPDHLRQVAPKYFERDGLCLAPALETADGTCVLCVYFQSRHTGHAGARFAMLPPRRSFWFGRHKLPRVGIDFECPGGAFGVVRVGFVVPEQYQGRRLTFEIGADVTYVNGKGELLRYREGKALLPTNQLDRESDAAAALLLGWAGILLAASASARSRVCLALPKGVAETVPASFRGGVEILDLPDLPTRGFPVVQKAAA